MRLNILTKLLFLVPLLGSAADEFTVYHPKFKSTEELVILGDSTFGREASFSSLGGKVVINASPKTTQSVLKLFSQIDRVSRQFKISFRLNSKAENNRNLIAFKDGKLTVGKKVSAGGTLAVENEQGVSQGESMQSAQLLEGSEAQVAQGSSWFPGGFSAKARGGAGDLVTVEFRQRESNANPAFSLQSEVLLKLGEWKTVGEVARSDSGKQSGPLNRGANQGSEGKELQVKIELQR